MAWQQAQFGYFSGQMFYPLEPGTQAYYYTKQDGQMRQVNPADCNSWSQYFGPLQACIYRNGQYQYLPEGTYFQSQIPTPQPFVSQNLPAYTQGGPYIYASSDPTIAHQAYWQTTSQVSQQPGYTYPNGQTFPTGTVPTYGNQIYSQGFPQSGYSNQPGLQSLNTIPTYPQSTPGPGIYQGSPQPGPAGSYVPIAQTQVFDQRSIPGVPANPRSSVLPMMAVRLKACSHCNHDSDFTMTISKKEFCLDCLKQKVVSGEMYVGEELSRKDWSAKTIFQVYNRLVEKLPAAERSTLPQSIPPPCNDVICIHRDIPVLPGYPQKGHFIGLANVCVGDACPDPTHILCKKCAAELLECPLCHAFIKYEEPPGSTPECKSHCGSFTNPCATCKKIDVRKKQPKKEEGKGDEVPKPVVTQDKPEATPGKEEVPIKPEEVQTKPADVPEKEVQGKLEADQPKEKPKVEEVKVEERKE